MSAGCLSSHLLGKMMAKSPRYKVKTKRSVRVMVMVMVTALWVV